MRLADKIRERMQLLNIQPKKSLGQNFLISEPVVEKVINTVKQHGGHHIIEIGPGLGALTDELIKIDKNILLLELDRVFCEFWREQNIELIEGDALNIEWLKLTNNQTILVSNLPYQISSSIVIDRSIDEVPLKAMILMFQKEVAQRIKAKEKTEEYGLLSVIAQTFWRIEITADAGTRDFFPPPQINSRVLHFYDYQKMIINKKTYLGFVKACFSQRRKFLTKNIQSFGNQKLDLEVVKKLLASMGYPDTVRAEEIKVNDYIKLFIELGLNK